MSRGGRRLDSLGRQLLTTTKDEGNVVRSRSSLPLKKPPALKAVGKEGLVSSQSSLRVCVPGIDIVCLNRHAA